MRGSPYEMHSGRHRTVQRPVIERIAWSRICDGGTQCLPAAGGNLAVHGPWGESAPLRLGYREGAFLKVVSEGTSLELPTCRSRRARNTSVFFGGGEASVHRGGGLLLPAGICLCWAVAVDRGLWLWPVDCGCGLWVVAVAVGCAPVQALVPPFL